MYYVTLLLWKMIKIKMKSHEKVLCKKGIGNEVKITNTYKIKLTKHAMHRASV